MRADGFSIASPRVDVGRLPAYAASRRGRPDDAARRARVAAANAALLAGRFADALDVIGAAESGPIDDVVGVRLATGRGFALASLVRLEASAAAFLAAGEAADRLGWLARASGVLHESGSSAWRGSAFAAARTAWERRMSICELRADRAGAAVTLNNLGLVYESLGDYAKALETQERALAAAEALGDEAGAAETLGNIGLVYQSLGEYATALSTYKRALSAKEALGDKAGAALTLANIGSVYQLLGDTAKALSTFRRVLAASEGSGDQAVVAATLANIGNAYFSLGDHAKALAAQERALAALEALGDKAGAAATLGNMGNVFFALGDHAKALATQERALSAKEAMGDKAGAAATLVGIGNVYYAFGDSAKALAMYERGLAASEALGDRRRAAQALGNLALVYGSLGDHAKALAVHERALVALEALGDKAGVAQTLGNIGAAHSSLGDTAKAIKFLERAVRAAEKLGADHLLVSALRNLALLRLESGDAGRAIESAHQAVRLLKTLVRGLGEEQGAVARGKYSDLFATGVAASAAAEDVSEAAFFLESGRAGSLLESLDARDSLRHAAIPEDLRLAEAAARAGEARALVSYTKSQDAGDLAAIRTHDEALKAARANVQEVVERIQRDAKREANLWYPVATPVEDIQGFVAPGEALVLYGLSVSSRYAYALVLTRGAARLVVLEESSEIVAACEALDLGDRDADPAAALARLRDLVVRPLGLPKDTKRLLVSPEGPLSYVPFAALAPDLVVAYESSGSTYGVLREEKEKRGEQVLALADADYTAKFDPIALDLYAPVALAAAGTTRGGRLAPLPGTREEAMAVADVRLFGKDASESGLRAALGKKKHRWHSVHFACHGLVNPDRPTLSSLALTPEGEDDGFLTALEVLKMEIPSDLVVLSACETGKGKIVGGEGIVGLTRAFMYAGSPRVICSLWKVDDDATRALMTKFYESWNPKDGKPGLATAEALRKAQEFVKSHEKWKHPYYWAAWVLWGLPE